VKPHLVLCLKPNDGIFSFEDLLGYLLIPMGRETM
jgi:hypothetical protein